MAIRKKIISRYHYWIAMLDGWLLPIISPFLACLQKNALLFCRYILSRVSNYIDPLLFYSFCTNYILVRHSTLCTYFIFLLPDTKFSSYPSRLKLVLIFAKQLTMAIVISKAHFIFDTKYKRWIVLATKISIAYCLYH